ncbi:MAG: MATE family efflux transporter [Eubacteriales bacterium]|nr:MATE family efflux transporter [Eubacteriales bacterium]
MSQENNSKREAQYKKMTETPVPKLIVTLSIPTIISMLITSIYNMVDTAFVGQLGTSASGAVGVVFGFMAILQALAFMFGQGSGSILSRKLGQKDYEGASRTASTGFFCAFACGIVILILGILFINPLVYLLGSTKTIAPYAKTYITYILIAAPATMCSFVMNNMLRYEGKASLGMIGMLAGSILNMAGDPIFMFRFNMGIAGAGLSTALSQYISFFILLSIFIIGKTQSKLSLANVSLSPALIGDICATGFPSLIRQALASVATMILNKEAGLYGDAAVAAMSIVSRIAMFVFSFALGIGQGFQPISAFNYGAKKYSRVRKAALHTGIMSEVLILCACVGVLLNANTLIALFRDDPEVIRIGIRALNLHIASLAFMPFGTVVEMMLQSTGYRLQASIMSSLRSGVLFIPLLVILANVRGLAGIQEAQPLSYVISIIPSVIMLMWYLKRLPKEDA